MIINIEMLIENFDTILFKLNYVTYDYLKLFLNYIYKIANL